MSTRSLFCAECSAVFLFFCISVAAAFAQTIPAYKDTHLPIAQRVDDLVSKMTLEEKVSQMRDHAPAIPRLGVPKYDWWNEGLHGVAFAGAATNFPQVIGMAATWDTTLVHQMAETISTEARAKYNQAMRDNDREMFFGLTFWAPNINIFRDPRWGRGQETYGEDPYLTSRMGVAFVTGMQGEDPDFLKVVSTPKHFAVHSGPESLRHKFNTDVSPHDLEDTYLPAFRAAITEGKAQSIMCAYNSIDGEPACANTSLLQDHLRKAWHFNGYVVSDCAAVADIATGHKFAPDFAHAAADAVKAGTDLECGFAEGQAYPALVDAVKQKLITEAEIDIAVKRLFTARFRLGMFNPPNSYAYGKIPFSEDNSDTHRSLSLQAARESIVLLKNGAGFLPLNKYQHNIAVIGPNAALVQSLQGNYNGPPPEPVFPLTAMENEFGGNGRVVYAQGATLVDGFPMPIERTALQPAVGSGPGLTAEYYANPNFKGTPVLLRIDPQINFNWDKSIPLPGMPRDEFSVRWTGTFTPPAAGDYRLGVRTNFCYACVSHEIYRLFIDGKLLVDNTKGVESLALIHFDDTKPHKLRLEYVHHTDSAGIDLIWRAPQEALLNEAVATAKQSDVIVAFVGLSPSLEGEEMPVKYLGFSGGDRTSIDLPETQEVLLEELVKTHKPLVVVLMNGSALSVNWAQQHASAIIEAWYPGEEGGTAIAETLAGQNNPAGRLPMTFYASQGQLPSFEDYSMANRTYRYFDGKPLYGFGFGLSYSSFTYSNLKLPLADIEAGDPVNVEVDVKNTSQQTGSEVVELYLTQPKQDLTPIRELAGFTRINLRPNLTTHLKFSLDLRSIAQVNADGERVILPGTYEVSVGGSQPGDTPNVITGEFKIKETMNLPK
jgi:beta-glucosidase